MWNIVLRKSAWIVIISWDSNWFTLTHSLAETRENRLGEMRNKSWSTEPAKSIGASSKKQGWVRKWRSHQSRTV